MVFPAYAGMIRDWSLSSGSALRVPRLRGDDPVPTDNTLEYNACSPPTRG